MTLRDQFGEIETGIGDLFDFGGATLSIVCLDSEASTPGRPILTVRLYKGVLEHQGRKWTVEEGKNPPLFYFTAELVASCLRQKVKDSKAREVQHPPEFEAIPPYQEPAAPAKTRNEAKAGSQKKKTLDDQPMLEF